MAGHQSKLQYGTFKIVENFWYPILDIHDLPKLGKLLRIRRFSKNLVLWRTSKGKLTCLEDRCPHKGVPLGVGRLVGDCIQCPYHGMRFNPQGECTHVPAFGANEKIPKGFAATSYAVAEAHGFVWLWWGDAIPDEEIPFFPDLAREPKHVKAYSISYPASFYRLMESNFDGYHTDHLHGSVAPKMGPLIHDFKCEVKGRLIRTNTEFRKKPDGPSMHVINSILFPNLAMAESPDWKVKNIIACCPIDERQSWFMIRFYAAPLRWPIVSSVLNRLLFLYGDKFISPQDFSVQSCQEPWDTGYGSDQLIVKADKGIIEYWKMLRQELAPDQSFKKQAFQEGTFDGAFHDKRASVLVSPQ